MNEINKTLFIPLYGKSRVSRRNIILKDPSAERIWEAEGFPLSGRAKSIWLAYNMAMRARVFDDWTEAMLRQRGDALVLHIGCGLDGRCERIKAPCADWFDCDFPEVIRTRGRYFAETAAYHMLALDASDPEQLKKLPDGESAVIILEGLSMYLTNEELRTLLSVLRDKYAELRILMDVYTEFGARVSKLKNPVNEVGVTEVYGVDDLPALIKDLGLRVKKEHSFTPARLIRELSPPERAIFRLLFTGRLYGRIYRLYELEG